MFLKKRNISSKIKRSKVTDYAALKSSGNRIRGFQEVEQTLIQVRAKQTAVESSKFLENCNDFHTHGQFTLSLRCLKEPSQ